MTCAFLACVGDGGCVESVPAGTLGQVLTQGAAGPAWAASADDQTAAEVPFTPAGDLVSTTVQAALEELDAEKISSVASGGGITGNGTGPDAVRPDFDNLPLETGNPLQVVISGTTNPNGAIMTPYNLVTYAACNAPVGTPNHPDNFLVVRDPGTGCQIEQFMPFAGVLNVGAALPVAVPAANVQGDAFVNGGLYFAESNDTIPRRGTDGGIYMVDRVVVARGRQTVAQGIASNALVTVNYDQVDHDTHGAVTTGAAWAFTCPVPGVYTAHFGACFVAIPLTGPAGGPIIQVMLLEFVVNGTSVARIDSHPVQATMTDNLQTRGSYTRYYNAGDTISVAVYVLDSSNTLGTINTLPIGSVSYFSINKV